MAITYHETAACGAAMIAMATWPSASHVATAGPLRLFDDVLLEALDERDDLALLGLGHLELRHGRTGVPEEYLPVALADAHAAVREQHVPAAVVHRSTRIRAEEVDQELLLALDAVFAPMGPEATELGIPLESGQHVVGEGNKGVVTTEARIQGLLLVAHRLLLEPEERQDGGSRGGIEGREGVSAGRTSRRLGAPIFPPTAPPRQRRCQRHGDVRARESLCGGVSPQAVGAARGPNPSGISVARRRGRSVY